MTPHFAELRQLWHVAESSGAVSRLLKDKHPEALQRLLTLQGAFPIASTCMPFDTGGYARPVGHARSFIMRLSTGGQLVFKGSEPFAHDYRECVSRSFLARDVGMHSSLDQFALLEHEVFLGLRTSSALRCAEISLEYVAGYVEAYERLPKAPIPLMVLEVPEAVTQASLSSLGPYLSDRKQFSARAFVEQLLLQDGLAMYVYYMAGTPIRLAHAKNIFPGAAALGSPLPSAPTSFDLEDCVGSWCRVFAEMLAAGFVPTTPVHTGNCMQSQNLTIDGGITDIDSIERIDRLRGRAELFDAIVFSLYELTRSVLVGLGMSSKDLTPVAGHVYAALSMEIRRLLREDAGLRDAAPEAVSRWATGLDELPMLWKRAEWDSWI